MLFNGHLVGRYLSSTTHDVEQTPSFIHSAQSSMRERCASYLRCLSRGILHKIEIAIPTNATNHNRKSALVIVAIVALPIVIEFPTISITRRVIISESYFDFKDFQTTRARRKAETHALFNESQKFLHQKNHALMKLVIPTTSPPIADKITPITASSFALLSLTHARHFGNDCAVISFEFWSFIGLFLFGLRCLYAGFIRFYFRFNSVFVGS